MRKPAVERIHWWSPTDLSGIQILECDNCPKLFKAYHEMYTVCVMKGITCHWEYRGRTLTTEAGDLALMEPGEMHNTLKVHGKNLDYRVVLFPPDMIERAAWELSTSHAVPRLTSPSLHVPRVSRAFLAFHASLDAHASLLERQTRMTACIRLLLEHAVEKRASPHLEGEGHRGLLKVCDYLRAHFAENVSLDDLTAISGLSRFHLVRRFAREFGAPPHSYQVHLRIAKAQTLLAQGVPAAVAAAQCGFFDQSHMILHFHRIMGVSPGIFQSDTRNGRSALSAIPS